MKNKENKKLDGDQSAHIKLKVKTKDEKEVLFRIKRNTQLKKLMDAYCNRKSYDLNSIMFLFNGHHLRAEQTPLELDMEEGDEIDVLIDGSHDLNHKSSTLCDLDSHIAEVRTRTTNLSELTSLYESEIKEALYDPVEALLKKGSDDTWPAIRNLLHQETAKAVSGLSFALSGFEICEQEKEDIILNLKTYSRGLVEGKAREEAGKVLYYMKERFTSIFKHDDDLMPRVWTGKEDIQAITKTAQYSSLNLLSMLAAIRLDEEVDTIRDTLVLTLMDPKQGNSDSTTLRDQLASSTWEEVPATKTLITPVECRSLWNQFLKETEYIITQAIASQSTETNDSVPSSEGESQFPIPSNIRSRKDITWNYVSGGKYEVGTKSLTCIFCHKIFRGGGISRVKQHLAGVKGDAAPCLKVPQNVRFLMQNALKECSRNAKEKLNLNEDVKVEAQTIAPQLTHKKRKASSISNNLHSCSQRGTNDPTQPLTKSTCPSKERLHDADLAIAMWFYAAGIPMSAVNSPLFPIAMSKIASMGHGYTGPSYHAMRVTLLKDAKQSVNLIIDSYRKSWSETGCTIMSDGWRDSTQKPLINFFVYCPEGISFIKSVDVSGIESNAESLCNLFGEIVEIVGCTNVVHLVSDNADNYEAAGRLLLERYPSICWSPCATHRINRIMKDVSEMPHVADLLILASRITVFIYNHSWPLNWLRKRDGWTEIIRPSATRFGTSFIALESLYNHRSDLQAMVNSNDYKVLELPKANDVKLIILDETFWDNCSIIVKVMSPLLRILHICDSGEKPSLGYVYGGMHRAKKDIEELFHRKTDLYKPYTDIIDAWWDEMLCKSLHLAAYWLNPIFQYDKENVCHKRDAFKGVLDMIEKKPSEDSTKLLSQLIRFGDRDGNFGRPVAFASLKAVPPDEWWRLFGGDVPELQKFAIRILSQTASSSGCERNWSVFEKIHSKRRNRLEHQRLSDLVYVHYNLRLQNRLKEERFYDPIDIENIDKTEFWVTEEEAKGELDYVELENLLDEPLKDDESSASQT